MAWTFDLAKLHAQVRDVLPAQRAFAIDLSIWDHRRLGGGLDVEVDIYTGGCHYRGRTPDEALTHLLRAYGEDEIMPADLGLVEVPTGAPVVEYGGVDNDG